MDWKGKVALVTGAGSGIGKATAREFAKRGTAVVLADVAAEAGEQVANELRRDFDARSLFVRCDVMRSTDVAALVDATMDRFGRLDFAFNNAGIEGKQALLDETSEADWDRTIAINLKGVWLCMKHELPAMLKNGGGAIVNCSSIAGLVGFPAIAPYVASKHGVLGLTKTAALEYAKRNVRVNAVCPGVIATPMIDRFSGGDATKAAALSAGEPIGRMGRPEEIADAVLWLCSDESSFVTGHALAADGGWTAQ